jgi:uncharacterized membrane protein YdjX (TVP38/TMEM64 family)
MQRVCDWHRQSGQQFSAVDELFLYMTEFISDLFQRMGHLTAASGLALGLFFLAAALITFPRTLLVVTAGATFGLSAAPIILIGGTIGAILAFSLSRYVASAWFRRKLQHRPMLHAIAQAVDDEGWRIVALMRLGGPMPSVMQNYAFGLTNIDIVTYGVATLVFTAPQIFLFCFLGATGRAAALDDGSSAIRLLTLLTAIFFTLAIVAIICWRVRSLLKDASISSDVEGPTR